MTRDFSKLKPSQVARYLMLKWHLQNWDANSTVLQELETADGVRLEQLFDEHNTAEDSDARSEVRHSGYSAHNVSTRIHYSWERHYDVSVSAIPLTDKLALAFNYVEGGGKHGEPDAYKWYNECWFVDITGTKQVTYFTFADQEPKQQECSK